LMAVEVLPTPPLEVEIAIFFNVYFLRFQLSSTSSTGRRGRYEWICAIGSVRYSYNFFLQRYKTATYFDRNGKIASIIIEYSNLQMR